MNRKVNGLKVNILLFLLSILVLLACEESVSTQQMPVYDGPVLEMDKVSTLYSDSARVRIKLTADKQLELEGGDRRFPEGVYIVFYEEDQRTKATIRADRGFFFQKDNLYKGEGNVEVENMASGEVLNSEELYWDPKEEEIYTDKFVTILSGDEIHKGEGLRAAQDFSTYTIIKPMGTITVEDDM